MCKYKTKVINIVIIIVSITTLLMGCDRDIIQRNFTGDELIIAQGSGIKSLDPHATNDQPSLRVMSQIYDTLTKTTNEMKIVPGLAEDWEQIDSKTLEMTIRKGVFFHNGEELKAHDVKFSLERMMMSPEVNYIVYGIDSIEIIDDYKIRINTKGPHGALLNNLSHIAASIISKGAVQVSGKNYGSTPIGTGPYKFVKWNRGETIELERFDKYYLGKANIEKLTFEIVSGSDNRVEYLKRGEIDIAYDIDQTNKEDVFDSDSLRLIEGPSLEMDYLGFNLSKKPFDDKRVRKAINHAIDVDRIINNELKGIAQRANSPIGPRVFGHNPDLEYYNHDIQKAKRLLREAGYMDGFNSNIFINNNPLRIRIAKEIQRQLKILNINIDINILEWGEYLDKTASGQHDMFISGWIAITEDADYGLYPIFHSSKINNASGNRFYYKNQEVDRLLEEGSKSTDMERRQEVYNKAQEIIVDDAVGVFLYYPTQNVALQKYIRDFSLHPGGYHSIYKVYFEK